MTPEDLNRLEERFWAKVSVGAPNECWLWVGAKQARGYGTIWVDGRLRRATQISWEIHNKEPFPIGKMACHSCDNPPCVNPNHVWPGSMRQNVQDAISKGRFLKSPAKGKDHYNQQKTHCPKGHPYSGDNLSNRSGQRRCKTCEAAYDASRRARKKTGTLRDHDCDA